MNILITGASGHIGSNLIKYLASNYKIFGIYRMNVRKVAENPDSTFTPIPATITPAGLELDPDTPENLDSSQTDQVKI